MNASGDSVDLGDFDRQGSLIYGIGNVGRQDDGLGWAFVDLLETSGICPNAEKYRNYQLQLEDADLLSRMQRVLFVDATKDTNVTSFEIQRPAPMLDYTFTSHALSIPAVLATCQQCFDHLPDVYVLAIRGYEFDLQIGLTPRAQQNLDEATARLPLVAQRHINSGTKPLNTVPRLGYP